MYFVHTPPTPNTDRKGDPLPSPFYVPFDSLQDYTLNGAESEAAGETVVAIYGKTEFQNPNDPGIWAYQGLITLESLPRWLEWDGDILRTVRSKAPVTIVHGRIEDGPPTP